MRDTALYERLLDLKPPWKIANVDLRLEQGEVVVHVEVQDGVLWACPACSRRMQAHDHRKRRWRHLDTCQFKTIIEADVPRVKCPLHGAVTVQVPWAERNSRFTALFERLAIDLLRDCSIQAASNHLRLSWDECDHIKQKAVARGLKRKGEVVSRAICIDEKSVGKGHDYITVVAKLTDSGPVVDFIADGREQQCLDPFWAAQSAQSLDAIDCVSVDMWKAYINSVEAHHPAGRGAITHDPFHVIQHMNKALDAVRRREASLLPHEESKALKGTRQMWLYGMENLPEKWDERMKALKDSQMKTARAWRLKETLRAMYQCANWTQAESLFTEWYRDAMHSKLEPVKRVARMLKAHLPQVLNFFIHRVTNAYSEGINSIIQALIKRANGYRSRERLKRDLLFHLGGLDLYPLKAQYGFPP
jgi:transposase